MALTRGGNKADGVFKDEAELASASVPLNRRVEVLSGRRYVIQESADAIDSVQLDNSYWANPVIDPKVEENSGSIDALEQDSLSKTEQIRKNKIFAMAGIIL